MHFQYGEYTPFRLLDEASFWKHQEQEHTVVIRQITPGLERKFVEELKDWETAFTQTHAQIVLLTEALVRSGNNVPPALAEQVFHLISFCQEQSSRFIRFLFDILSISQALKETPVAVTVIKHIIRESEYFLGITQIICSGN